MKPRLAIIAALPREINRLVNGWRGDEESPGRGVHIYQNEEAIVVCAGMGAGRAALAAGEALARGPVAMLFSVGFAGALRDGMKAGKVVRPSTVIDAMTGERFAAEGCDGTLVTVAAVAGTGEKMRLRSSYAAEIVDMEAAGVARIAVARGVAFAAVKAVSDEYDFELPELARFAGPLGEFREGAFAMFLMARPRLWKSAIRLARGSALAAQSLAAELRKEIERRSA